ncbi:FecCD family ABC transporter permease [Acetobacterium woodii]|uniref:Fe(III) ABC transport system permease protein MtsB n=1 Tax=Acetobacterium woodii (strain ATCC 29683 / DSM 1030 / JCM 2381 / KCTC 1655 / WB1) TaxID=931626 RepID=H6LIC5_ACEWD|nr:iron ABC transporter permease [Acetobacterium woodii]AFA47299.1 Fe(III) ABC transport system permease protein MtsB [Acetobacterium woodii DSM 1030]
MKRLRKPQVAIEVDEDCLERYQKFTAKKAGLIIILCVFLLVVAIFAMNSGAMELDPTDIVKTLMSIGTEISSVVVWRIRLPRILAAVIAGAGLAVAGCVMQNNLKNPLASPSTLGISSAAAFGANIAIIVLGAGTVQSSSTQPIIVNNPYLVTSFAFAFSMGATMVILLLARMKSFSPEAIVLAGVALSSLFAAGTTLIQYFAESVQIAAAVFWTFGDLGRAAWTEVFILAVVVGLAIIYFMMKRWDYNALDNGADAAKSLGVNVERTRLGGMLVASMITAVTVSFLGVIGFIGLVAPQMVRRLIGGDHRFLIPISALMGSLLLLVSDTFARTIVSPIILPVGAITSFLGAPLFLYLLLKGGKRS